jgi:hypothetical protein
MTRILTKAEIKKIIKEDAAPVLVKDCAYCSGLFKPRNVSHKFCTIKCRKAYKNALPYQFSLYDIPGRQRRSPGVHSS